MTFHGGESGRKAARRAVSVVEDILESEQKNTIIVTHGNLMVLLLKHFQNDFGFEQWRHLTNPDMYRLRFKNTESTIDHLWRGMR